MYTPEEWSYDNPLCAKFWQDIYYDHLLLGGICCPVSVTWIFAPFGNSRFEVGRTTLKLLHLPDSIWNSLDSNAIYISNYCTARIFCPVCKLQGTGNIEIASYSVSVQTLRFYHAFRDWNTVVGSNCCPFQLPKRGPVPVTETGPRSPNLPFQLPKQGPVPQTSRFSYRNGALFPKPPVSVTSVDLFPCLQSQLKNERGDPNLLVFPYLSSASLVILKKWRRESFTYNKYLFILSKKKHKKNKWKCRSL